MQRFVVTLPHRIGISQFTGKLNQRLAVSGRERTGIGTKNEYLLELEPLRGVNGHQPHRVLINRRQRNHAASLTKVIEVFEKLGKVAGLGYRFVLPKIDELENCSDGLRFGIKSKPADHNLDRTAALRCRASNLSRCLLQ